MTENSFEHVKELQKLQQKEELRKQREEFIKRGAQEDEGVLKLTEGQSGTMEKEWQDSLRIREAFGIEGPPDFEKMSEEERKKWAESHFDLLRTIADKSDALQWAMFLGPFRFQGGSEWSMEVDENQPTKYGHITAGIISILLNPVRKQEILRRLEAREPKETFLQDLQKAKIASGWKLAEIGGALSAEIFRKLGGESDFAQDDIPTGPLFSEAFGKRKEAVARHLWEEARLRSQYITLRNYSEHFPQKYDITTSNFFFDYGVLDFDYERKVASFAPAEEQLAIFAGITKEGGISIHEWQFHGSFWWLMDIQKKEKGAFLEYIGLREVGDVGFFPSKSADIKIFQKTQSKRELFPDGYRLLNGKVVYVTDEGEITLKVKEQGDGK